MDFTTPGNPEENSGGDEQRRHARIAELQKQWDLLNEKLSRLEHEKILETRSDEKFRLEHEITETKAQLQQVEEQLRKLENQTNPDDKNGSKQPTPPPQNEIFFVEDLFELFYTRQAVLLFAQADQIQGKTISDLQKRAEKQFGKDHVLHLVPPHSPQTDLGDYFSVLAKQCYFAEPVKNAATLRNAFEDWLTKNKKLFLLVSSFENGCKNGQEELAGVLRSLNERYANELRVLICGGEKLVDLYYNGDLSYLNHAEIHKWPEFTVADVHLIQRQLYPEQNIDDDMAQTLLDVSGGHPRLLQHCLNLCQKNDSFNVAACYETLLQSPFVWQIFAPFRKDAANKQELCQLLAQHEVGPAQTYLFDPLLRRLYWKNLLKRNDKRRLVWRCEVFRKAGWQILGCEQLET